MAAQESIFKREGHKAKFVLEGVIFDFDGTMVDSEGATLELAKPIISRNLGREILDQEMKGLKGKVWKKEFQKLFPISYEQVYN